MKVVAFNGSPRKTGNTSLLIRKVFEVLEAAGIECELVHIGGRFVRAVRPAEVQGAQGPALFDRFDIVNECIEKMLAADGIIIGSHLFRRSNRGDQGAHRPSGHVARQRQHVPPQAGRLGERGAAAGSLHVFDTINAFFHQRDDRARLGTGTWPWARDRRGGVRRGGDVRTMEMLGVNMAWLLGKIHG